MSLTIRAYNGESAGYITDWTDFDGVEIAFDEHGPADARVTVPRCSTFLHHSQSAPGGVGAFVEVDATGLGVPDLWTGRLLAPQYSGDGPTVSLALKGPQEWLDKLGVPAAAAEVGTSADIVRDALAALPAPSWVRFDDRASAAGLVVADRTDARSMWGLMTDLATSRGETFFLTPASGVDFLLTWGHPVASRHVAGVTLAHGVNATMGQSASSFGLTLDELVGVAESYGVGADVVGAIVSRPAGPIVGLRDALAAPVEVAAIRELVGQGKTGAIPAVGETTAASLEVMLATMLRRASIPQIHAQFTDVACDLWPSMRPGNVVSVAAPDPFGYFESAYGRITSVTFRVTPPVACNVSVELWATKVDG